MIYVLGVGPGEKDLMTIQSSIISKTAEILIGGKRNLASIENYSAERFFISSNLEKMKEYILENIEKKIVVVASGDPSIYGVADYIIRELSSYSEIEVIPGISSIQYAFSVFKINMNNVYITSSHGRNLDFGFIFKHDKIAMLTDSKIDPREIAQKVIESGKEYKIYVGENLSYANENLTIGSPEDILNKEKYSMSVVILEKIVWSNQERE